MCEGDVGLTAATPQGPSWGGMVTGVRACLYLWPWSWVVCAYVWTHACECVWGGMSICMCVDMCMGICGHVCVWWGRTRVCECVFVCEACVCMCVYGLGLLIG